ncbi:MAG: hypothetical protein ACO2ZM_00555 [Francisellaceae bacterium]
MKINKLFFTISVAVVGFQSCMAGESFNHRYFNEVTNHTASRLSIGPVSRCYVKNDHTFSLKKMGILNDIKPGTKTSAPHVDDMNLLVVSSWVTTDVYVLCPVYIYGSNSSQITLGYFKFTPDRADGGKVHVSSPQQGYVEDGLVVKETRAATEDSPGQFDINKNNIQANNLYVCVYNQSPGIQVDYTATVEALYGFQKESARGRSQTITNNKKISKSIYFADGSQKEMVCSESFGSFSTGNASTVDQKMSVTVANDTTGQAYVVNVGSPAISGSVYSAVDYKPEFSILGDNPDVTTWNISNSKAWSGKLSMKCPGGYCFSGDPDGDNDVYIVFQQPGN